jgi:hypothetical protein
MNEYELPEWTNYIFRSLKWTIKTKKQRKEFIKELQDEIAKYPEEGNWIHHANDIDDIVASKFNDW